MKNIFIDIRQSDTIPSMRNIIIATLTILFIPLLTLAESSGRNCIFPETLENRIVLLEEETFSRGTGVLYEKDIIISNHTVTYELNDPIDIFIPAIGETRKADVIYTQRRPDLSFLKLREPLEGIEPLDMPVILKRGEPLIYTGFVLGNKLAKGTTKAWFVEDARFTGDNATYYFKVNLKDWGYAGDVGGAYFTCKGQLAGVNFGHFVYQGDRLQAYGINTRALARAMDKTDKVEARRY